MLPPVTKLANELLLFPVVEAAGGACVCGADGAPKLLLAGGGVEGFPLVAKSEKEPLFAV